MAGRTQYPLAMSVLLEVTSAYVLQDLIDTTMLGGTCLAHGIDK